MNGLSKKDFAKAKAALEKANIPPPHVLLSNGEIKNLEKWREENEV